MVMIDYWKFVVLQNYANFTGRAGRAQFWWFVLANFIISVILSILVRITGIFIILEIGFALAVIIPSIAVAIRRLHDTNKTGWWILIGLVPFIGFIVLLVFYIQEGTPGPNDHGNPDPGLVAAA